MPHSDAGLTFREVMRGPFALGESHPPAGARAGVRARTELALHARLSIPDVKQFVADRGHRGALDGIVVFSPLAQELAVRGGFFQLFARSGSEKLMVYRATFPHQGSTYCLNGVKHVGNRSVFHLWQETTTLHCTLHAGEDPSGEVVGAGILRLTASAFARQLLSFSALNGGGMSQRAEALSRFFVFFAGELLDTYVARFKDSETPNDR